MERNVNESDNRNDNDNNDDDGDDGANNNKERLHCAYRCLKQIAPGKTEIIVDIVPTAYRIKYDVMLFKRPITLNSPLSFTRVRERLPLPLQNTEVENPERI